MFYWKADREKKIAAQLKTLTCSLLNLMSTEWHSAIIIDFASFGFKGSRWSVGHNLLFKEKEN